MLRIRRIPYRLAWDKVTKLRETEQAFVVPVVSVHRRGFGASLFCRDRICRHNGDRR